ncbi:MAG TPA: NAD-dependent epimerase/dehydratase family protein [Candidatus Limnocylindria bacterium]|nr:NAD-dependent epimerase/dehydratase family protein [Candidatus Limnocylindria bacterium]
MRVFVTGATGYLGSAIAARLRRDHEVHGLTHSAERADSLAAAGIHPVLGDLANPGEWLATVKNCDAVVHAAYDQADAARQDQRALEMVHAAARDGRVRHLLYTSGVWVHGDTGSTIVDESAPLHPAARVSWRPAHEEIALDLGNDEVVAVVLRPGMVYGETGGTFGGWFRSARQSGVVTIPGDGSQRWTMVHRDDVAEGYRLALEHAAMGQRFLLVDESRHTVRELAEAVARVTGAQVRSGGAESARPGSAAEAMLMSQQAIALKARRDLGWVARHGSFVAEIESLYAEWQAGQRAQVV